VTAAAPEKLLVIIPAFNEEGAIQTVIREVRAAVPGAPVLVIDDCSLDETKRVAREAGAQVLPLPHHLGLGGCVQAGYKLAYELGYDYVARVDGDGQHNPADIPRLLAVLKQKNCQMVIGSRYSEGGGEYSSVPRGIGIRLFRALLRPILGKTVHDPTSGFVAVNREALAVFSHSFPLEYPEIEALVVLQRKRFRFEEVECVFRDRMAGVSTITPLKSFRYMVYVMLGVLVNILRFERRKRAAVS
jgi:glycosyltransferase involved in cell wall biosynthesis